MFCQMFLTVQLTKASSSSENMNPLSSFTGPSHCTTVGLSISMRTCPDLLVALLCELFLMIKYINWRDKREFSHVHVCIIYRWRFGGKFCESHSTIVRLSTAGMLAGMIEEGQAHPLVEIYNTAASVKTMNTI